jgi:hypothetical protein
MWQVIGLSATFLALIITILALAASAIFYFMSARQLRDSTQQLQHTMNVLGHYLKATIKDAHVDLNINKKGDIVGLNISGHAEVRGGGGISAKGHAIKGNEKPD